MGINITAIPRKLAQRRPPARGVGIPILNIPRDPIPGKEPNANRATAQLSSIDSATVAVECIPICLGREGLDPAACVRGLARCMDVAVTCFQFAGKTSVTDCAACPRVEGHGVPGLVVYAFDDVDFTIVWPAGADGPACLC